ncbi:MAG: tail fiber domain-containing protein [Magnetococcales bacterium]|nr:tail fiber domain-containing protein [Magnetococcales bacterium]
MKRSLKIITLTAIIACFGSVSADSITKPNTFVSGGVINASEVNANFDGLYTQINKIGSAINTDTALSPGRISIGGVSTSRQGLLTTVSNFSDNSPPPQGYLAEHNLVFENSNATVEPGVISRYPDGSLRLFSYSGGTVGESRPITFHRHGTSGGEVMRIHSNGNVGIGTSIPEKPLHILSKDNSYQIYLTNTAGVIGGISLPGQGGSLYESMQIGTESNHFLTLSTKGGQGSKIILTADGNVGIGRTVDQISYPLHMASGAYVTSGGIWTNASSREYKDNITVLSLEKAQSTLGQLNPVTFTYKKEPDGSHVGFIAEDVPDLVATKDRKGLSSMDIVAVVTKVVQDQQKTIKEQDETIQKQGKEIQSLTVRLQEVLAGIDSIQKKVGMLEEAQQTPAVQQISYGKITY